MRRIYHGGNGNNGNNGNNHNGGDARKRAEEARRLTVTGIRLSNDNDEKSWAKSVGYFKKAIELGDDPVACRVLGMAYFYAHGVEQSYEEAANLFRHAAELGDPEGMYRFAVCRRDGLGVEKSYEDSYVWLECSARCGFPLAEKAYGYLEIFSGIEDDKVVDEGIRYICDAAAKRDEEAQALVVRLDDDKAIVDRSEKGDVVSTRALTDSQIATIAECMYKTARSYREDSTLNAADEEIAFWLSRSANDGNPDAMCLLAIMMLNEDSPLFSRKGAVELMFESAYMGNPDAEFMVGQFYHEGFGVERDYDKSFEWLMKASADGSPDAKEQLVKYFD